MDVRRRRLGVVLSLEASYLESRPGLEVLRELCLVRVAVKMQRVPGCYKTLSRRASVCGDVGEGWVEELFSLRPQLPESLAEE
jgi:hypothetical protein